MVSTVRLKSVSRVFLMCSKSVLRMFKGSKSQGCFKSVARVIQECFKCVSKVFEGCFKGISRVLQGCLKEV